MWFWQTLGQICVHSSYYFKHLKDHFVFCTLSTSSGAFALSRVSYQVYHMKWTCRRHIKKRGSAHTRRSSQLCTSSS